MLCHRQADDSSLDLFHALGQKFALLLHPAVDASVAVGVNKANFSRILLLVMRENEQVGILLEAFPGISQYTRIENPPGSKRVDNFSRSLGIPH
jgi:hypothetical protein